MTSLETSHLRLATDGMTLVASLSVCAAFLWVLLNLRGRAGPRSRPIALMCLFVFVLAVANVLRDAARSFPDQTALTAFAALFAAAAMATGLAISIFVAKLVRQPTHNELLSANEALRAERDARLAAVDELSKTRDELERRVDERTQALDLARRRFEIALQGTGIVVTHQDRDLRYTWIYNPPAPLEADKAIGQLPEDVLPKDLAQKQAGVKRDVIRTGEPGRFDAVFPSARGPIWYEGRVEPLIVDGRIEGVMTVSIDVTRHMLHERQMQEVLRELTHRSKNLLAVVQAMARQSSADAIDMRDFIEGFDIRLQALSRAHELLVDTGWRGVSLRAILDHEFAAAPTRHPDMAIDGPDLQLSPEAAQNFALAISELASDLRRVAPKEGARLAVSWAVDETTLHFSWRRTGGEATPRIDAFGENLLKRVLPRQIDGEASLSLAAGSIDYTLKGRVALLGPIGRKSLQREA